MVDFEATKSYLQKLKKIIRDKAVFSFGNRCLTKYSEIQDVMCCILAILPVSYKKNMTMKSKIKRYNSIKMFALLNKALNRKFFLDKNLCVIDIMKVNQLIDGICSSIIKDISSIEGNIAED